MKFAVNIGVLNVGSKYKEFEATSKENAYDIALELLNRHEEEISNEFRCARDSVCIVSLVYMENHRPVLVFDGFSNKKFY